MAVNLGLLLLVVMEILPKSVLMMIPKTHPQVKARQILPQVEILAKTHLLQWIVLHPILLLQNPHLVVVPLQVAPRAPLHLLLVHLAVQVVVRLLVALAAVHLPVVQAVLIALALVAAVHQAAQVPLARVVPLVQVLVVNHHLVLVLNQVQLHQVLPHHLVPLQDQVL